MTATATKVKPGVYELLDALKQETLNVARAASERREQDEADKARAAELKLAATVEQARAARAGEPPDMKAIDDELAALAGRQAERAAIGRDVAQRATEGIAHDRSLVIEEHREQLLADAAARRDEADICLMELRRVVAECESARGKVRSAYNLALTDCDEAYRRSVIGRMPYFRMNQGEPDGFAMLADALKQLGKAGE